jgi:hypothetical protein
MAADRDLWVKRVAAWQTSGRTAKEFSRGQEYAESALRYWSTRLRKEAQAQQERQSRDARFALADGQDAAPKKVRLARVVPRVPASTSKAAATRAYHTATGSIVIAVGAIRVLVEPGFDAMTLGAVVDVLDNRVRVTGGAR